MAIAGLWFGIFANLQLLTTLVPSDFGKSLVLLVGPVCLILISPYAGKVIDRSSHQKILTWSGHAQLICSLVLLAAFLMQSVILIIAGLVVLHVSNAFYTPAIKSVIPSIVPKEQLLAANSMYLNTTTMARITITGITGIALAFVPLWGIYLSMIGCYLVMNGIRYFIKIGERSTPIHKHKKVSFLEVFQLLRTERSLIILLINIALIYLFLGGSNLIILEFSLLYDNHAVQGFLYGVEGVALLIAGVVVRRSFGKSNTLKRNTLFVLGSAIAVFCIYGGTKWLWIAFAGYAMYGFIAGCWFPSYSTLSQLTVPESIRGRFFAFQEMWNRIMQQLALVYTGIMFDWVGLGKHLLFTSIIIFSGAALVLGYLFMNLNKKPACTTSING
ncbi:MFS transporter [Brevibacillus sp. SYSU BS000544]|uniref:MFS transporter n=1 Tax=Brevibacillus sp. SYSU BS000544 TaxID=3416443 RepID=UPI003CE52825